MATVSVVCSVSRAMRFARYASRCDTVGGTRPSAASRLPGGDMRARIAKCCACYAHDRLRLRGHLICAAGTAAAARSLEDLGLRVHPKCGPSKRGKRVSVAYQRNARNVRKTAFSSVR
jgi:hypothetical protein